MAFGRRTHAGSASADVTGFLMGGRRLAILKRGVAEHAYPVGMEPFAIGRDKSNHIVLDDHLTSKFHARIIPKQDRVGVQDLESRNGTRLNERRVQMQMLMPGDVLRIGHTCLIYLVDGMPVKRRAEDVQGWVSSCEAGSTLKLPVCEVPLLFGRAPEADQTVQGADAGHYHTQVVAIPGGAQSMQLTHDVPHVQLIRDNEEFTVGRKRFAFRATHGEVIQPSSDASVMRMLEDEADRVERNVPLPGLGQDPFSTNVISARRLGGCHITATRGPLTGKTFVVTDKSLYIGSDPKCDIVIDNAAVSRRHAKIHRKEGDPMIEDLSKALGLYVNGQRVRTQPLKPGDTIQIATDEFMVHL
jgi:pSer/pThr/pTyr-binding forkhead associated (FHA) protein